MAGVKAEEIGEISGKIAARNFPAAARSQGLVVSGS